MSLAGDTISDHVDVIFSPTSIDSWVNNAVRSITDIVLEYHLDGIDIDYEHFSNTTNTYIFAECVGRLLSYLKRNGIISFSSIAPYESDTIQEYYTTLWTKYGYLIDYVNFQFYSYDKSTNVDEFLGYFNTQRSIYYGGKVLVSFSTDGSGGLSPRHGFFKACKILMGEGKLVGIFIWSADDSKKDGFHYEKKAQHFLVHGN